MAEKRKTHTSTEVKKRWIKKTYQQYTVSLRFDSDADLIEYIDNLKENGYSTTGLFRRALRKMMEE